MYQNLKNVINQYIKTNGARSITGALLNGVLNDMVDALGAVGGYGGIITPTSAAPQNDGNVFFVSNTAGTYTNFSNIVVNENELAFIYRSGNGWAKDGITLSAGGTEVEANPTGEATTPLNKIKIGDINYNIPQTNTSDLVTKQELQQGLNGKQDTISDLQQIRTRADEGHTALQPVQNATHNNFASFDANGGIKDSTYKAADFVQNITRGGSTLTKENGVVDIPEEIEDVVATPVSAGGSPTVNLANGTLTLGLPSGADAVNPFKGMYITTSDTNIPSSGQAGDYIFIADANPATTIDLYFWNTAKTPSAGWDDTGYDINPGSLAEFAGGTAVSMVRIINDFTTGGSGNVASAETVKTLDGYINGALSEFKETKAPLADYCYKIRTDTVDSNPNAFTGRYCYKIFVNEGDKFEIKGIGGTDQLLLYAICDSSLNIIRKANANLNAHDTPLDITIDAGGKYLIVNLPSYQDGDYVKQLVERKTSGGLVGELSNKLDKVETLYEDSYTSLSAEENYPKDCYLTKSGTESGTTTDYKVYKFPVTGGRTYYITGSTGDNSTMSLCSFTDSSGEVTTEGLTDSGVANVTKSRFEIVAPINAAYISIMQVNSKTNYHAKCEVETQTQIGTRNNEDIIVSVGDVDDLDTSEKTTIVGAINELKDQLDTTEENVGNKLDKISYTQEWVAQTAISSENGYINSSGVVTGTSYDTKTFSVTPSKQYRIKGRRVGTGSRLACFYIDDGNGGLAMYTGNVQKVGSEGVGEDITTVSNPVPDGDPIISGGATSDYHTEVYIAPENTVAIKIMSYNDSSDPIVCEEFSSIEINNQEKLNSIGDVDELDTENKTTLVDAINEINAKIPDIPTPTPTENKTIKILLVGSSHGMNTIAQVPWIAYKSGLDVVVGNVYIGSLSLQRIVGMVQRNETYDKFKVFENGSWRYESNKTFGYAIGYTDWDYISIQRSYSDSELWIETQQEADAIANSYTNINYGVTGSTPVYMSHNDALQFVLDLIRDNVTNEKCKVIMNSGFAVPSEGLAYNTTQATSQTTTILSTIKRMKRQFGIDFYPTALAVRNARNTYLRHLGGYTNSDVNSSNNLCYDANHLDYGIGCYVASTCLLDFIGRKEGFDVINMTGYGSQQEVYSFIDIATQENYTEPTQETMMVAKACAKCANDGFSKYLLYEVGISSNDSSIFGKLNIGDTVMFTDSKVHCIVDSIDAANNKFSVYSAYYDDTDVVGNVFKKIITFKGTKPTTSEEFGSINVVSIKKLYNYGNKHLMNRFKWKIDFNLGSGITTSNTKGYCGNLDTYSTILSGTISNVAVTSKPWDRTQPSTTLIEGTDYTYDSSTGKIVIGSVQGDITISAN